VDQRAPRYSTPPAQLNCDADLEAATPALQTIPHPHIVPWLPQTPCQFLIQNQSITSKIKRHVHHAAQTPKLHKYLKEKFEWNDNIITMIDWPTLAEILKKYKDKWLTMVKHLHDISPTGHIAHRNNPALPHECPACSEPTEDNIHVITCGHNSRRQWRTVTIQELRHKYDSTSDPHLMDILQDGLTRFHNQLPAPVPIHQYPERYRNLILSQSQIGWDQVYRGRWSTEWAAMHTAYAQRDSNQPKISGQHWVRSIGRCLIDRWLTLWKLRNEQRHGADEDNQRRIRKRTITTELQELYTYRDKVCPIDRSIFHVSVEDHLEQHQSMDTLESWITTNRSAIKASAEQAFRLGIRHNRLIHEYPTFYPSSQHSA
jgi:hypothetical protein